MSPSQARKRRGARTQDVVRNWFRGHGHPHAEDAPASLPGRDILGVIGWAPEVKARTGFEPLAWLRQAKRNAGTDRHCVVLRCNGQGEETVADWPVLLRLEDFTDLLTAAGYGDGFPPELAVDKHGCPEAVHLGVDCPGDACRFAGPLDSTAAEGNGFGFGDYS